MKTSNNLPSIFIRYFIILFAGLGNLVIFYKIFTTPTIYLVSLIINLFSTATLSETTFILSSGTIEIIPACVAGSAYYLLFILCLSVPELSISRRIAVLAVSFSILLIVNVLRISILSAFLNAPIFDIIHMSFWYVLSTLFVVAIWFLIVKIFSIKSIPFYNDLIFLVNQIRKPAKKSKRNSKHN